MRTIGFRSQIIFIIAAAAGMIAALARPWYAPTPVLTPEETRIGDIQGPVEGFFARLGRELSTASGTTGWDAFTSTDTILAVLCGVAVLSALCTLIPAIEQPAREIVRLVALAMLGIVVVKLANTPDQAGLIERRQGAWVALGVAGVMASSASTLYNAPLLRRRKVTRPLYDAPPALVLPAERSHVFDSPGAEPAEPTQPEA